MPKLISFEMFIAKSKEVHKNFYSYDYVNGYQSSSSIVSIMCPKHGLFEQRAGYHMQGHQCKQCGYEIASNKNRKHPVGYKRYKRKSNRKISKSINDYIKIFQQIHNNKYDYSLLTDEDYNLARKLKNNNFLKIICPTHGIFYQKLIYHKAGNGCQTCRKENIRAASLNQEKLTVDDFIARCKKIHNNYYDYSLVSYNNRRCHVTIICPKHGPFEQRASYHMDGSGCSKCGRSKSTSRLEHEWLDSLNLPNLIRGFAISTEYKRYVVDGYDPWSKTIYEFYGDYWHGNPQIFTPDQIMKHRKITFKTLYQLSMARIRELKKLGYNVTYIWESEWNKIKKRQAKCL